LRSGFWENEDEILKTERGFCSSRDEEQKPLPVFAKVPPVGRIEAVFQPHFLDFGFSCYSPDFAGAVSERWRRNLRN
jgi:hypothetical protein